MNKYLFSLIVAIFGLQLSVTGVSAHAAVKPGEVGVGERINFVFGVPTEEKDPTIRVRLIVPEGVTGVIPNTKPGWNIQLVKSVEGETERVSEIIWSGGRIPSEQRDEFVFSAVAPTETTTVIWKAYQTYGDGDVVAWENSPEVIAEYTKNNPPKEVATTGDDHNAPRPYSTTKVVNDLKASPAPKQSGDTSKNVAYVALLVSLISFGWQFVKKN